MEMDPDASDPSHGGKAVRNELDGKDDQDQLAVRSARCIARQLDDVRREIWRSRS